MTVIDCFGCQLFKASALSTNAFYKSICPYVCLCVCLCVCSLLRYRLNVRWLYNKNQEVIQQGSGGYNTRIRRLYTKDQEVMFSNVIIEPLQKIVLLNGVKSQRKKRFFSCQFCLTSRNFFWYPCYYPHGFRDALFPICGMFYTP